MNLRKKMVVGAIGLGLIVGSGTAFANTDAGQQLQNWYNQRFAVASGEMKTTVENHVLTLANPLVNWFNGVKNDAKRNIADTATAEINRATNAIDSAKDGYIDDINKTADEINSGMEAQFDALYATAEDKLDKEAKKYANMAKGNVTSELNTKGAAEVQRIEDEVTPIKETAKDALLLAIDETKEELQDNIDAEKVKTIGEIKDYINNRIETEKENLNTTIDGLKADKKAAIEAKGSALEAAAISELDAIVNAINN